MTPDGVRKQIEDFINRVIAASISVKQFYPALRTIEGGAVLIGGRPSSAIALRDVSYDDVYREVESNEAFDVKLIDGGLLIFQYRFDASGNLLQHRLAFFPSPALPTIDEAPGLYEKDELYGDITCRRLVRFPIRFDYAPSQRLDIVHPASHMTLGQYENCRIPVAGPLSPYSFGMFILRNFYCRLYTKNRNTFERKILRLPRIETISETEKQLSYFVHGR